MNLSTLRTFTSLFCNDVNSTRFSSAQYLNALNESQVQFALDSKCLFKDNTITVVSGTSSYSLPTDFMFEKQVTHKQLMLKPISRATMIYYKGDDWTDDTGTPKWFNIDPEEARKNILLYPQPTANDTGANLILTYYPKPTDLSADTDSPLNSSTLLVQFHIAIACWAAWMLLGYDQATPDINSKRQILLAQYNDKVTEAIDLFKNTASEPIRLKGGRKWR